MPESKSLFSHGLAAQGRMLALMIKFVIGEPLPMEDESEPDANCRAEQDRLLKHNLEHLARIHNRIGIGPGSYSIMGVVLLHAVRFCAGEAYWTEELKEAWLQVFSKMMAIMVTHIHTIQRHGERHNARMVNEEEDPQFIDDSPACFFFPFCFFLAFILFFVRCPSDARRYFR